MSTRDKVSAAELEQPGKFAWCVFDQQVYDNNKAVAKYDKAGIVVTGTDIADLATKIEVDPAALQTTVDAYNAITTDGATDEFGRTEGCIAFAPGAMYAIKVAPGIHHAMGGVRINANNQALDSDGNPIPGLFARWRGNGRHPWQQPHRWQRCLATSPCSARTSARSWRECSPKASLNPLTFP